jgi:hypothetical protein
LKEVHTVLRVAALCHSDCLKSEVFKAPVPHTVQELKHRIQQEVTRIPVEMLQKVMGDVRKRLTECLEVQWWSSE